MLKFTGQARWMISEQVAVRSAQTASGRPNWGRAGSPVWEAILAVASEGRWRLRAERED